MQEKARLDIHNEVELEPPRERNREKSVPLCYATLKSSHCLPASNIMCKIQTVTPYHTLFQCYLYALLYLTTTIHSESSSYSRFVNFAIPLSETGTLVGLNIVNTH